MRSLPQLARRIFCAVCSLCFLLAGASRAQTVFINEIHYDNVGNDAGEGIEITGPAGTDLSDYDLVFYNGTAGGAASPTAAILSSIGTINLSGTLPNFGAGYGVAWFGITAIENGANDGVALYKKSTDEVLQFLSWEGLITAAPSTPTVPNGPAAGLTSTGLLTGSGSTVVSESGSNAVGTSLQLKGTGTSYSNFTWAATATATPGGINNQQTIGSVVFISTFTLSTSSVDETAGSSAVTGTLILNPAPASPRVISLASSDTTEATVPATVTVPTTGSVTFPIAILNDAVADGNQTVSISITDPASVYPTKSLHLVVRDVDAPPPSFNGVLRVACFNVLFGVNTPGSTEYLAVKEMLQRIDPQVISFEEVDSANNFSDIKALLAELGFQITNDYFATVGDGFTTYLSGDFGTTTQCVCIASKFPITQRVQINRGVSGRKEMSRFPLFVKVDLPGVAPADDPAFVAVHLKASGTYADQFRRALETYRITQYLQTNGWDGLNANAFVLGDFNEKDDFVQPASFNTGIDVATYKFPDNTQLPASMVIGPDIAGANGITLPYNTFPHSAFTGVHMAAPETRQADGVTRISYNLNGSARLDYIFARTPVTSAGLFQGEVYNSRLETAFDGLPKTDLPMPGSLPNPDLSFIASDHFAVFADVSIGVRPKITITPSSTFVNEAETSSVNLSVTLSQAPASGQSVTVALAPFRPGRVRLPTSSITFSAGQTTAIVPLEILHPVGVDPHRTVTISGTAPGWFPGKATVEVRNKEAGGSLIVSQYLEPSVTNGPKAVELVNQSGSTIDFERTPLFVKRFTNGDTAGVYEAKVNFGSLNAGQTLVIGDSATGEYLLAQNLIQPGSSGSPTTAETGTAFFDTQGKVRFWKDTFPYNGNDALELLLNYTRMDVFGTIGTDPGVAWSGSGVSTANQNIELKPTVGTGTSAFSDPSVRFNTVSTSDALTGFGVAPVLADEYLAWAASAGLAGLSKAPDSDADGDGLANLLEYALNSNPLLANALPASVQTLTSPARLVVSIPVRTPTAGNSLAYQLEQSTDLQNFTPSAAAVTTSDLGSGMEQRQFVVPETASARLFLRVNVRKN